MAFSRAYTLAEVQGMLQIYRNNRAMQRINPANHSFNRNPAPAHAHIHAGASFLDMQARVNTPGEPRSTGTYWNDADQAAATLEVLNSMAGRIALRLLDIGEGRAPMTARLMPNRYRLADARDASDHPGLPGHLARNNPARAGAGSIQTVGFATHGFVLAVKGVGGLLQIQTSYPSAEN